MKTILRVTGLHVERGDTVILDDISWRVRRGEHWVVVGANGSGKTSLLSTLTGYLSPTSGEIEVLGERYGETDWRELRKRVGLVSSAVRQMMHYDEPAVQSIISGKLAMIDYWGEASAADRRRAYAILRRIQCEEIAGRPWRVLSQGERQRVLIGRALMADPPLLILDEPCAGLDPVAREHFLQFLQHLGEHKRGPTLVLVTHHVEEIKPVFTHVLVLKAGRVLAAGAKEQTLTTATLSEAFDSQLRLRSSDGRYALDVRPSKRVVI